MKIRTTPVWKSRTANYDDEPKSNGTRKKEETTPEDKPKGIWE